MANKFKFFYVKRGDKTQLAVKAGAAGDIYFFYRWPHWWVNIGKGADWLTKATIIPITKEKARMSARLRLANDFTKSKPRSPLTHISTFQEQENKK